MENVKETKQIVIDEAGVNIVMRHLQSFQRNDLEAVVSDYTNESVLITQDATYTGPKEIKDFFAGFMVHFPTQKSSFEIDKLVANGGLVYIVWHANTPSLDVSLGTDTFVIKDDKIHQQTFAGQLNFIN
jgi:ketosteroid isomerase-like protein